MHSVHYLRFRTTAFLLVCFEINNLNTFIDSAEVTFDFIAEALTHKGYCILPNFIKEDITAALYRRVMNLDDDDFHPAGIGRETDFLVESDIRRDQTRWLNEQHPVDQLYLQEMDTLRLAMNRRLFLGLVDYESHYAHYSSGAFYKKHLDAFQGQSNRVLTTVMYFNPDWQDDQGGELLIYHPDTDEVIESIKPNYGIFVTFLSEQFPHEVVVAARDRYSIAGWFRVDRPLLS